MDAASLAIDATGSARTTSRLRGMLAHVEFSIRTAIEAVRHNKLRAGLTSLGILFGVASVIAMLAIGNGAKQEILQQMKLLGANNIVITPIVDQKEGQVAANDAKKEPKKFTPGLTRLDALSIAQALTNVDAVSSEVVVNTIITREGQNRSGKVVGVDSNHFDLVNLRLAEGTQFSARHFQTARPVAIIGSGVKTRFFTTANPLGRSVKVGTQWLTVVGVLEDRNVSDETSRRLGIRDVTMDVFVPLPTMLLRFRNRGEVTQRAMERAAQDGGQSDSSETDEQRSERRNYHQLDRITVRVAASDQMSGVADVIRRMLQRRHNGVVDFEITVPELLLRQEQRTKTIFNIVLGAIASISLIVGGIGIMNIMLASILERIREIGVRRAMGATQRDIMAQFLSEAVMISLAGGVAGILAGVAISYGIERFAGIETVVSLPSVAVAFGVSIAVGLVFGIVPARNAARQDVINCLRYE